LEIDRSSLHHFLDIFFLEMVAQNDGEYGWSEL
jgi:hypothetical protein